MNKEDKEIIDSYTPEEAYAFLQTELKNLGIECPDYQNKERGKIITFDDLMNSKPNRKQ